jgi:integrase
LEPFFGERPFSDLNLIAFDQFFSWARNQQYRGFSVSNATLNKCMTVLKMVCKSAQIYYGWSNGFDPFAGCKKLPVEDPYEKVNPFSIAEQKRLIQALPDHWKPYFKFAFCIGLRQGEQIGLKPADIDWDNQILTIRRAMTRDEHGRPVEGRTKNKYSRRSIKLLPVMMEPLIEQRCIADQFESAEYFFCTPTGSRIHPSNFRRRVWIPALQKARLEIRDMRQTRHSFATNALSCGENPLWIANVLGHRNTEMIIKVYSKYVEKSHGSRDGQSFNALYQVNTGNSR